MKQLYKVFLTVFLLLPCLRSYADKYTVEGWPGNYDGVMLQGFYWDSYSETSWKALTYQVGELSKYFDLIWVPNSGKSANNPSMGYDPVYWFTNHDSSFGKEQEIRDMIQWYKLRGTGIIEDVVVNHRNGVTNWTDFPVEVWGGKEWFIGLDGICSNDEVAYEPGQPKPTGSLDEGDNFDGCRDLDHTNANVQENVKNYCRFLLEDMGYIGFRYDMVKGYAGYYTGMYNLYSKPQFSVGEYFDGSYDNLTHWIKETGKLQDNDPMGTSAAFDFACKFQINEAFNGGENMRALVWEAGDSKELQPAGLIHYQYQQKAVTFVDNHDTYRDNNKFNGNVLAANAFILCSPGTPCVFWVHYRDNKEAIQQMIMARKAAGITNTSRVKVLKSSSDCYMAELYGTRGTLVVKVGSAWDNPENLGYTSDDIYTSGDNYCIWVKTSIGMGKLESTAHPMGKLYLNGNFEGFKGDWDPTKALEMGKEPGMYILRDVKLEGEEGKAYFSFADRKGEWAEVNQGTRYGAPLNKTVIESGGTSKMNGKWENSWQVENGVYDIMVDASTWKVTVLKQGDSLIPDPEPDPEPDPFGEERTVHFKAGWNLDHYAYAYTEHEIGQPTEHLGTWPGSKMTENNGWYTITVPEDTHAGSMIIFNTGKDSDYRYPADGSPGITLDFEGKEAWYLYNPSTNSGKWYASEPKDDNTDGIGSLTEESIEPVFFNMQGMKVSNPSNGIFIKVTGNTREKVLIK